MSETTIKPAGASIVRAFRRINAAAEVIAAARALVRMRRCQRDDWKAMGVIPALPDPEESRLDAAITAYDATEAP